MSTPEGPTPGPCTPWVSAEDVAAGCDTLDSSGDPSVYDTAALSAAQILYLLSGRQFSGLCGPVTVRPCQPRGCPPLDPCGCCHLSTVKLAGVVREVSEVKIDGAVIDAGEYRVDRWKWLVRLADADGNRQSWPGCQRLDLDDTEERTFSVTYSFGVDPPSAGLSAATELACQLAGFGVTGNCDLPVGATRIVRQGITVEIDGKRAVIPFGPLTSLFLNTYNPAGLRRRSAVFSPDIAPFARQVGP